MLRLATALSVAIMGGAVRAAEDVTPLPQAHAHNDYEHQRPLLDALDHGFTSVEADIWLVDGELLVAHDEDQVDAGKTLQGLYLDPLRQRIQANDGTVYTSGQDMPITLLIDIKSEGVATYEALNAVLEQYKDILTVFRDGDVEEGAVTAVISGERPRELMEQQQIRYAGYDGRMTDFNSDTPATFMPLLSDNWTKIFTWVGEGEMPADERAKLDEIIAKAHEKGWKIRFWATPDEAGPARKAIWTVLRDAGVDHINTDDLAALQTFLQE